MKKVTVEWTEFHNYEAEIEIPDNLSKEEELDWIMENKDFWWGLREPYEINTDWESFYIEEMR